MICFYCLKEIEHYWEDSKLKGIDGTMVALEKPYANLWFHKKCVPNDLESYLNATERTKIDELCYNSNRRNWYDKKPK